MEKKLGLSLDKNLSLFKEIFSKDSVLRYKKIGTKLGFSCAIVYFDGMVNTEIINESVVKPLILAENKDENEHHRGIKKIHEDGKPHLVKRLIEQSRGKERNEALKESDPSKTAEFCPCRRDVTVQIGKLRKPFQNEKTTDHVGQNVDHVDIGIEKKNQSDQKIAEIHGNAPFFFYFFFLRAAFSAFAAWSRAAAFSKKSKGVLNFLSSRSGMSSSPSRQIHI